MSRKRKYYGRKSSKTFRRNLKQWRTEAKLTLEKAAERLGLKCKSPGSYLWQMENGKRTIPDKIIINVARVYRVPEEEVIRHAYYPQLHLPLLMEVIKPTALPKEIDDFLDSLEGQLKEKEKKELAIYAKFLLLRRHLSKTK